MIYYIIYYPYEVATLHVYFCSNKIKYKFYAQCPDMMLSWLFFLVTFLLTRQPMIIARALSIASSRWH